jgi:protein-S-isoprenylcysteine O-methyltransferase Ste14
MAVRDQQTNKGNSDCDGRNQNPSSTLPVLHHLSSSLFSIPIFRLFRPRVYNGKMKPFGYGWPMWTSIAMWCVIEIYWDVAKKNIAPETDSESRRSRWLHLLLCSAAQVLIFLPIHGLRQRFLPASAIVDAVGLTLNAFGLVLAIWSRRCLGRYWSGKITIKVDHQLIRSGPYRLIRHPIYTALLSLYLGTAIVSGELHALIGWVLVLIAYLRKIRLEEKNLLKAFGEEYRSYQGESWALLPGVF